MENIDTNEGKITNGYPRKWRERKNRKEWQEEGKKEYLYKQARKCIEISEPVRKNYIWINKDEKYLNK